MEQRLIVYIDGFNLYHGMYSRFRRSTLWLDLPKLAQSLRPNQKLVKVKYFTAPVLNQPDALKRQQHYLDALVAKYPETLEVTVGRYQTKSLVCRKCGSTLSRYEEKETDVNIAVAVVADASQNNMDTAIVISADSDLAPGIRMAQKLNPQLFITAAFPPKRFSSELKNLMSSSFHLGESKIRSSLLPDEFSIGAKEFRRPSKWY